ncbi:MAG: hypothetical protein E7Z75_09755 [Methanobrevibacter olleyae]|uniref:Uncharacterized protein n=1 Tax=Methanobrevibacter olleyae TaxID=294671 RepID=A0A8T3VQF7_METOL|nr:hypothetical protein [Methanobrevibacter olleyae]
MVKITDPKEDKSNSYEYDTASIDNITKLNPDLIREMLKPVSKHKTTPVNIRLEESIVNQIKLYATEHETTVTEVLKDIITQYYTNKKIIKGVFDLKEPVTLIIPRSKELRAEYCKHRVNLVSSIREKEKELTINPIDPQINLYENSDSSYELITITQVNNLLDLYDPDNKCYHMATEYPYYDDYLLDLLFDELENDLYQPSLHRGLLLLNTVGVDNPNEAVLVDVTCYGNTLEYAYILNETEAMRLAGATHNEELIKFIHRLGQYSTVFDLVSYDKTNKFLREENKENKEFIKVLIEENEALKDEIKINENTFKERTEDETTKYMEGLEKENRRLQQKIKAYEFKDEERAKQLERIEELIQRYKFNE